MDRGGHITWYLDADDSDFDATVKRVSESSKIAGREIDKNINDGTKKANKGLQNFRVELAKSASLFRNFQVAIRGFTMTAMIIAVVAATGALIELAGAVTAVGALAFTLPSIISTLVGAMGTLKTATYGMGDAFKAVAEGDAEDLAKALEKLSPTAKEVVAAFGRINDSFKPIRTAVQDAFFKDLGGDMDAVAKVTLPTLETGLKRVAVEMNGLMREAAKVAQEPFFQEMIANSLETTAKATTILTGAVRPLAQAFAGLIKVGDPYVIMLAEWVVKQTELAGAFLSTAEGQAALTAKIDLGLVALKSLGDLLGSVTDLLVTMFDQSTKSGVSLIGTLTAAFDAATQFLESAKGSAQFQAMLRVTNLVLDQLLTLLGYALQGVLAFTAAIDSLPKPAQEFIAMGLGIIAVLALVLPYFTALATSFATFGNLLTSFLPVMGPIAGAFLGIGAALGILAFALAGTGETALAFQAWFKALPDMINNFMATLPALITKVGEMVVGVIEQIVAGLPLLIDSGIKIVMAIIGGLIQAIPSLLDAMTSVVEALVAALVTALPMIIEGAISLVQQLIGAIVSNLPQIIQAGVGLVTALLDGLVQAAPVLFAGVLDLITTLLKTLMDNLPAFLEAGKQLLNGIMSAWAGAIDTLIPAVVLFINNLITLIIQSLPMLLQAGLSILTAILDALILNLPILIEGAIQIILALVNALIQNLPQILIAAVAIIFALVDGLIAMLPQLIEAAITIIMAIAQGLIDNLPTIIEAAITLIITLAGALLSSIPLIITVILKLIVGIVGALIGAIPQLIGAGVQLIFALIIGLGRVVGNVISKIVEIGGSIISSIGDFVGKMASAGGNLIQGLVNGISNAKNAVVNKVKEIASGALDAIKNFFGIHSPSRVMAKMGNYMMEGLNKGIIKTGQTVIGSTQAVANSIAATFGALDGQNMSATINGNVSDVSGVSGAVGSNYLNETSNNSHIENHIGTISIADEVDAENWLKKLTREDEITRTGLTA